MKNRGCMSAGTIGIALIIIFTALFFYGKKKYTAFNRAEVEVDSKWANIQKVYQKRSNLIPNMERTVNAYSKFEQKTLAQVTDARQKAISININPTNLTEENLIKFRKAQNELSTAMKNLALAIDAEPALKEDLQYINFQEEYQVAENNIQKEIIAYDDAAKEYNATIKQFPSNIFANFTNFKKKPLFQAETANSSK